MFRRSRCAAGANNSNFHHQTYNMPSATIKENAELIIVVDADAMVDTSK